MLTVLIDRREFLYTGLAALPRDTGVNLKALRRSGGGVTASGPGVKLRRRWYGGLCRSKLTNSSKSPVHIKEAVLFRLPHRLPPETRLYAESFQMLSQTGGTLARPADYGYSETRHYKIPQPADAFAATGLITLTPPGSDPMLLGFASCRRFHGRFFLRADSIEAAVDTEGLELGPGQSWEMEDFFFATGPSRPALLAEFAARIQRNHRPLPWDKPPTGWCSWYCFGPRVTARQVLDNLDVIAREIPGLRYVQIDDGYQRAMGDWLETGDAFGGNILGVLREIRRRGFEPAIWVAPFIAEAGSHLFEQHPDWFMKGSDGDPLPANKVTFGGWRRGPWYALDATHPAVQRHLEGLFRSMRNDWGCTYFKLDANFWGAMHGARLHDPEATRIEAYRRGMEAILRGAGGAFLLGCNHPLWASFGLIHGSRSSADISRKWPVIRRIARQNLQRNWQNGRLWWNDPDAVVLTGDLPENEFRFHATAAWATGGMVLSGDDLTRIPPARLAMLRKLLPPTGIAAEFADQSLAVGTVDLPDARMVCLFNWGTEPQTLTAPLPRPARITDFWSGEDLGRHERAYDVAGLPPRTARLLVCR